MKHAVMMIGLMLAGPVMANGVDPTQRSRALADQFQGELMKALQAAIAEKGVAGAVGACTVVAPEIAWRLSAESGAVVRRTALRTRNPAARPDAHETAVLEDLATAPMADGRPREVSGWVTADDADSFRYMRAIPTGPVCVACHGKTIAPDVAAAIAKAYPEDKATGFVVGDLRGAFSIRWDNDALTR
jgi:hypothetical protein